MADGSGDGSGAGLAALTAHALAARVAELDHYRTNGGVSVETDYIVEVTGGRHFEPFHIAKTYAQFRHLVAELKEALESVTRGAGAAAALPEPGQRLARAIEVAHYLVENQPTQYLGKVSLLYVRGLAQQRRAVLDDVLRQLTAAFPTRLDHELHRRAGACLEVFLLTDHCDPPRQKRPGDPVPPSSVSAATATTTGAVTGGSVATNGRPPKTPAAGEKRHPLGWAGGLLGKGAALVGTGVGTVATGVGTVATGVGTGLGAVASGVGTGLSSVTSSVGVVVRKLDVAGAFCATDDDGTSAAGSVRSRRDGAGGVRESRLVPMTVKTRHSLESTEFGAADVDEGILMEESLDESLMSPKKTVKMAGSGATRPAHAPSTLRSLLDSAPVAATGVVLLAIYWNLRGLFMKITIDGDFVLAAIGVAFYLGHQSALAPQASALAPERPMDKTREILRRTSVAIPALTSPLKSQLAQLAAEEEEEPLKLLESPLPMFPKGAKIGSHNNCWSVPEHDTFSVRGATYLDDRKKVHSDEFLFPVRGIDLFLTDTCPENVGSFPCVFGGNLRTVPTFIINFRLPWGVLIFYFEIPEKFIPFVRAGYEPGFDQSSLPSLDDLSPGERAACRFLMKDLEYKNRTLKIVPVVVDGPWIVRNVVGGKPAIIGTKLPVNYVYQAAEADNRALYLEADLDITASSAARGILSVTRSYTEILTIDLGFVVQGNARDELPEQMLVGCRIHGVDPLTAPQLPPQSSSLFTVHDHESTFTELAED